MKKYRRQPNGKKLTINVAVRNTQPNAEKIWTNYIQQWQKIGLDAKFVGGRPMEFNSWVQDVQADSPKIDVFEGGWSLSSEPSPMDLYSEGAPYNMARLFLQLNLNFLLTLIQLRPSTTSTVYKHLISGNNGCMTMPMLYLPQTVGQ